eukprot:g4289.t1
MSALQNYCSARFSTFVQSFKRHEGALRERLHRAPASETITGQLMAESAAAEAVTHELLGQLHACRFVECTELLRMVKALTRSYAVVHCGGNTLAARAELMASSQRLLRDSMRRLKVIDVHPEPPLAMDDNIARHDELGAGRASPSHPGGLGETREAFCVLDPAMAFTLRLTFCAISVTAYLFVDGGVALRSVPAAQCAYRCLWGAAALQWLCGLSIHVWSGANINYPFLFQLEPDKIPDYTKMYDKALRSTIGTLLSVLCFKSLLVPLATFVGAHRWFYSAAMAGHVRDVAIAPCLPVGFFSVMVGDYLTSSVKLLIDWAQTWCTIVSGGGWAVLRAVGVIISNGKGEDSPAAPLRVCTAADSSSYFGGLIVPLVIAAPLWWRFQQCIRRYRDTEAAWPNLANAFKYAMCMMMSLFVLFHRARFHPFQRMHNEGTEAAALREIAALDSWQRLWVCAGVVAYVYAFWWDVCMDWGLGHSRHCCLAETLVLGRPIVYYCAIVTDLVLRFAWMLTLIPPSLLPLETTYIDLTALLMLAEFVRRTMWSFFRVEHEHRSNVWGFRTATLVPPIVQQRVHRQRTLSGANVVPCPDNDHQRVSVRAEGYDDSSMAAKRRRAVALVMRAKRNARGRRIVVVVLTVVAEIMVVVMIATARNGVTGGLNFHNYGLTRIRVRASHTAE